LNRLSLQALDDVDEIGFCVSRRNTDRRHMTIFKYCHVDKSSGLNYTLKELSLHQLTTGQKVPMMTQTAEDLTTVRFPRRADGLDISEIDGGFMVHQAEFNRVHYLNHTAVLVLELCNGRDSVEKIAGKVQEAYSLSEPPEREVLDIVIKMETEALVIT